jgi:hypothetical protein
VNRRSAVAVIENPFAGKFVDDLTPLIDAGEELGALLAKCANWSPEQLELIAGEVLPRVKTTR